MLLWIATEARTGRVIEDLPLLEVDKVGALIGSYTTTTASLPVPSAPAQWLRATTPGAVHLVLVDDPQDGAESVPLWGGMVTRRTRTAGDKVDLSLSSGEAYWGRRYVGDVSFAGVGQNNILASLVTAYVKDGAIPGVPLRVDVATPGMLRDRTYRDGADKTVLSVASELSAVIGGNEFTVGWEWQHNPERLTQVIRIADRLGSPVTPGLSPAAIFEVPGRLSEVQYTEDYAAGRGATDVMAVSTASDTGRPQSPRLTSGDPDRPTFEFRFTPTTSITDLTTLSAHAQSALTALANGSTELMMTAVAGDAEALGRAWFLGDDVGYQIGGLDANGADLVPSFPGGMSGVARAVGWELTLGNTPLVTPILVANMFGES